MPAALSTGSARNVLSTGEGENDCAVRGKLPPKTAGRSSRQHYPGGGGRAQGSARISPLDTKAQDRRGKLQAQRIIACQSWDRFILRVDYSHKRTTRRILHRRGIS